LGVPGRQRCHSGILAFHASTARILADPKSTKSEKSVAASALTQARDKKKS
jgi:hypothetical protein